VDVLVPQRAGMHLPRASVPRWRPLSPPAALNLGTDL
jgi:hypothetical protein